MSDMNVMMKCSMKNKILMDLYIPRCAVALICKSFAMPMAMEEGLKFFTLTKQTT